LTDYVNSERYMGLPRDDPEGYQRGSAINFASGLKGQLLVVHGTGDDNVHFQGSQMLINKLVQLGKQFTFMEYPNLDVNGADSSLHTPGQVLPTAYLRPIVGTKELRAPRWL
jgi:hypothetical protein